MFLTILNAVTVHTTSTLWVGSNGSPVPAPSDSGPNKVALGVGLGLAMPGEHEMRGEGRPGKLPGQARSPPPDYSHAMGYQAGSGGQAHGQVGEQKWELA
jgi:hypothetical protein